MIKFTQEIKATLPGENRKQVNITGADALLKSLYQPRIMVFVSEAMPGDNTIATIDFQVVDNLGQPWIIGVVCDIECTDKEILCKPLAVAKVRTL